MLKERGLTATVMATATAMATVTAMAMAAMAAMVATVITMNDIYLFKTHFS